MVVNFNSNFNLPFNCLRKSAGVGSTQGQGAVLAASYDLVDGTIEFIE